MTTPHPSTRTAVRRPQPPLTSRHAPERAPAPPSLSQGQRILAATTVTCALILAGIGFTGSYTALRDLATRKGFGAFACLFPLGIDAGICITLALDLLLTWIRIPFPLLRPTAWLLTAATIAFNAAVAWPDPVGTGMHAVLPLLFIICVEASRHAIGRIADITADTHMQSIRPIRWLLSPLPTLLLWRRMKLWELRSYHQAIKCEQERLVYQARLHNRYGRAWRRRAPAESLTPLKLARYGIPLSHTVPAGLAAAGIKPTSLPLAPRHITDPTADPTPPVRAVQAPEGAAKTTLTAPRQTQAPIEEQPRSHPTQPGTGTGTGNSAHDHQLPRERSHGHPTQGGERPNPQPSRTAAIGHPQPANDISSPPGAAPAHRTRPTEQMEGTPPHTRQKPRHTIDRPSHHWHPPTPPTDADPPPHTSHDRPQTRPPDTARTPAKRPPRPARQTTVDRYYQVWHDFLRHHGREPTATELSTHLAHHGTLGKDGQPLKPKTLARYLLNFRIYTIWATHRAHTTSPDSHRILEDLADHGITTQYNKPLEEADLNRHQYDYERRWHALTHIRHTPRISDALPHRSHRPKGAPGNAATPPAQKTPMPRPPGAGERLSKTETNKASG